MIYVFSIIFTILAIVFFNKAKEARDQTGAVRTWQTLLFVISLFLCLGGWVIALFKTIF